MILNVDDHEPGRYAKSRVMKLAGYEVAEAGTGQRALELVASLRPDLIMLDVNLPDIGGLEVCRLVRADPESRSIPILQISASAITTSDRVDGLDNGADAYLIEPVDSDVLVATVRALLRMRKAEMELAAANKALLAANGLLERSNEELQRFSYAASHDLREPLRTIACFSGMLSKKYAGQIDADADAIIRAIKQGVTRMTSLIDDLLVYAQAGQASDEDTTNIDLNEVLASTLKNLDRSIKEVGSSVQADPLPVVSGTRVSLSQLFQNLIHNAVKYRAPETPGRIRVTATKQAGNTVTIAISDNGVGIAPHHQSLIFEPFQRLHGSEVAGYGIGLATCKRIVERHGGKIWAESGGIGKGSTFYFTLPLAMDRAG